MTKAQKRAISKLKTKDAPVSAYELQESLITLDSLVRMGLAKKSGGGLGSMFSPRTAYLYQIRRQK